MQPTGVVRKYYSIAGQMVAVREYNPTNTQWSLSYLLTDHLGSVVAVSNADGTQATQKRYLPFGELRAIGPFTQTDFGYTSQREIPQTGLIDYRARMYSPALMRFIQPDSMIPSAGNSQAFNRYSYVYNSPINFSDPTGHVPDCEGKSSYQCRIRMSKWARAQAQVGDPLDKPIVFLFCGVGDTDNCDTENSPLDGYILWTTQNGFETNIYDVDGCVGPLSGKANCFLSAIDDMLGILERTPNAGFLLLVGFQRSWPLQKLRLVQLLREHRSLTEVPLDLIQILASSNTRTWVSRYPPMFQSI